MRVLFLPALIGRLTPVEDLERALLALTVATQRAPEIRLHAHQAAGAHALAQRQVAWQQQLEHEHVTQMRSSHVRVYQCNLSADYSIVLAHNCSVALPFCNGVM